MELEAALNELRDNLNDLSSRISAEPTNTSLVIRRVNLMGRIMTTQSTVDRLRDGLAQSGDCFRRGDDITSKPL